MTIVFFWHQQQHVDKSICFAVLLTMGEKKVKVWKWLRDSYKLHFINMLLALFFTMLPYRSRPAIYLWVVTHQLRPKCIIEHNGRSENILTIWMLTGVVILCSEGKMFYIMNEMIQLPSVLLTLTLHLTQS